MFLTFLGVSKRLSIGDVLRRLFLPMKSAPSAIFHFHAKHGINLVTKQAAPTPCSKLGHRAAQFARERAGLFVVFAIGRIIFKPDPCIELIAAGRQPLAQDVFPR